MFSFLKSSCILHFDLKFIGLYINDAFESIIDSAHALKHNLLIIELIHKNKITKNDTHKVNLKADELSVIKKSFWRVNVEIVLVLIVLLMSNKKIK